MTTLTRRHLIGTIAGAAAVTLAPRIVAAQSAPAPAAGPFKVDPLAFAFNALEPHIDAKTMQIHHDLHHGAYVNNLNTIAKDHPQIAQMPVQDVLAKIGELPEAPLTFEKGPGAFLLSLPPLAPLPGAAELLAEEGAHHAKDQEKRHCLPLHYAPPN